MEKAVSYQSLKIAWWNIQVLTSKWFDEDFWQFLDVYDVVFLSETHHTALPCRVGWRILGTARNITSESTAGGVLAMINLNGKCSSVYEVREPFDGQ
eukprot:10640230-Karenia_brevis.AAC.1